MWKHWHVDRTWQNVAESEHDNISSKLSNLNEGPLLRRLLETLGMVEIPQVTLPSPPKEENGRNHSQQWKSNEFYTSVCHQHKNQTPKYYGLNDILWSCLQNHVKSTSSKIFKAILCQNPEFKPKHGFKVRPHLCWDQAVCKLQALYTWIQMRQVHQRASKCINMHQHATRSSISINMDDH